jgi:hypothetical protein
MYVRCGIVGVFGVKVGIRSEFVKREREGRKMWGRVKREEGRGGEGRGDKPDSL